MRSNRPDGVLLRFEGVIVSCISRFPSKERGDMQRAKAADSLRPRGRLRGSGTTEVSDIFYRLSGCVSVVSIAPARGGGAHHVPPIDDGFGTTQRNTSSASRRNYPRR